MAKVMTVGKLIGMLEKFDKNYQVEDTIMPKPQLRYTVRGEIWGDAKHVATEIKEIINCIKETEDKIKLEKSGVGTFSAPPLHFKLKSLKRDLKDYQKAKPIVCLVEI